MASSIMIQSGETARLADTRLTARPPVDDMILFNFVFFFSCSFSASRSPPFLRADEWEMDGRGSGRTHTTCRDDLLPTSKNAVSSW